jgi:hypothetical protein
VSRPHPWVQAADGTRGVGARSRTNCTHAARRSIKSKMACEWEGTKLCLALMIGCLGREGSTCPVAQPMRSTCAWRCPADATSPCRAPGGPLLICHSPILSIDNCECQGHLRPSDWQRAEAPNVHVQTVLLPDCGGRHLLFQDIKPTHAIVVRSSLRLGRLNKHWQASHVWAERRPRRICRVTGS